MHKGLTPIHTLYNFTWLQIRLFCVGRWIRTPICWHNHLLCARWQQGNFAKNDWPSCQLLQPKELNWEAGQVKNSVYSWLRRHLNSKRILSAISNVYFSKNIVCGVDRYFWIYFNDSYKSVCNFRQTELNTNHPGLYLISLYLRYYYRWKLDIHRY